jgi:hypothetical protein
MRTARAVMKAIAEREFERRAIEQILWGASSGSVKAAISVELLVTMLDINATRAARMLTTMDEESTSTKGICTRERMQWDTPRSPVCKDISDESVHASTAEFFRKGKVMTLWNRTNIDRILVPGSRAFLPCGASTLQDHTSFIIEDTNITSVEIDAVKARRIGLNYRIVLYMRI